MANRIQLRRDTTANWENTNPVLADGEMGYDIVTNEIRIGNGSNTWSQLSANTISGGGGALTGNVTFDGINIIGNDNLRFQPNATVTDGYIDVYLTVGPDIHVVASNSGNLILGPDSGANVRISGDGNVQIQAQDIDSISTWTFNPNGNLILPLGGTIGEAAGDYSILLTPYADPQYNPDMAVKIYPTMFDDDHIHITAGNVATVDLYLGDDDQYVKIEKNAGDVVIGTIANGSPSVWQFGTDGNLTIPGNLLGPVSASPAPVISGFGNANFSGNVTVGNLLLASGGEITTAAGTGNVVIEANDGTPRTYTFGSDGTLTLPRGGGLGGGDEGAEIAFTTATTSTLAGNTVIVDQYVNRLRFFESGGGTRGAYIDLTYGANNAGTLLNNRVSGFVNAGANVIMDSLKATVTTSDERGLSLAATTGSFTARVAGTYANTAGTGGSMTNSISITTSPSASLFGWNFVIAGDMATYIITDITNDRAYRVTMQIGNGFDNNMISIERLV
jgi:hypothetical protein